MKQNWKMPAVEKIMHDKLLKYSSNKKKNAPQNYSERVSLPKGFPNHTILCSHSVKPNWSIPIKIVIWIIYTFLK